ncbi:hypothetical protein GCM10027431_32580 [Lysobacter rhizosphaerae]
MDISDSYLRRYTDLPALFHILRERKITLLDPETWDDSNDSHYLLQYKNKKQLKTVLALCFSQSNETYHHWRIFSGSPSGVCIRFSRNELLAALNQTKGITCRDVTYLKVRDAKRQSFRVADLPFLKRAVFTAETELRALYESKSKSKLTLDIPVPLASIKRITLSPWLVKALAPATKAAIRSIDGCANLDVRTSTIVGNLEWKEAADRAK